MSPDQIAGAATAGVAVLGLIGGWWKWGRPRIKRARRTVTAVIETLVGRDAITDASTGRELVPAQAGLGVRMAQVEDGQRTQAETLAKLTETVASLNDAHRRLDAVEHDVAELKQARNERAIAQAESAQMYRLLAEGDPDLLPPPKSDD